MYDKYETNRLKWEQNLQQMQMDTISEKTFDEGTQNFNFKQIKMEGQKSLTPVQEIAEVKKISKLDSYFVNKKSRQDNLSAKTKK